MFDRILRLISEENFQRIRNANIFLIGVGGVGGYVLESLVRSGVGSITICDFDVIEESNMNRQIIATSETIGNYKVDEAKKRMMSISPTCNITIIREQMDEDILENYDFSSYDFVCDACDDVRVKVKLLDLCFTKNIPIVSCMGTGNRLHPEMLEVSSLKKTMNDPLAKRVRQELRKLHSKVLDIPVVWSRELPISTREVGTICSVPMAAGAILASYVLNKILRS